MSKTNQTIGEMSAGPSIVAAEIGAEWEPWVRRFQKEHPDVQVMIQTRGESGGDFGERIRRRMGELLAMGLAPARAVLVGGYGRGDASTLRARSLTVRSLAAAMATRGGGELFLDSPEADRFTMAAIADAVMDLVRGTGVAVRAMAKTFTLEPALVPAWAHGGHRGQG